MLPIYTATERRIRPLSSRAPVVCGVHSYTKVGRRYHRWWQYKCASVPKTWLFSVTLPVHQTEGGSQRVRSRDPLRLGEFLESPRKTRGSLIYISTAREARRRSERSEKPRAQRARFEIRFFPLPGGIMTAKGQPGESQKMRIFKIRQYSHFRRRLATSERTPDTFPARSGRRNDISKCPSPGARGAPGSGF